MRYAILIAVLPVALAGCDLNLTSGARPAEAVQPSEQAPVAKAPLEQAPADANETPAPAETKAAPVALAPVDESDVMAYVNGKAIGMDGLHEILVRAHGITIARQLIANELVRQALAVKGLAVTEKDVEAESDRVLTQVFPDVDSDERREELLGQLLAQKGLTLDEWRLTMKRNAMLRKLLEPEIEITEPQLREQFVLEYGGKVRIRHIQVDTLADAQKALKEIRDGADFVRMVVKFSTHTSAKTGGLVPPFGETTPGVPPAMKQAALALKQIGEVSNPVQIGTAFHILRLDEIIEPQDVKFEDVKDTLAAGLKERQIHAMRAQRLKDIVRQAQEAGQIRYVHPGLKAQADEGSGL